MEKELGVVVNEKFAENQQCTFVGWKACSTLGCIKKLVTGREMEMTVPFVLRPGMGLPEQEGHRAVGVGPEEARRGWSLFPAMED